MSPSLKTMLFPFYHKPLRLPTPPEWALSPSLSLTLTHLAFTTKQSRRPRLSLEAKTAKAVEYQREKDALIAAGTAKKIDTDDQPQILNYGTNQCLAKQGAAIKAAEEKQAKHEKYLAQKAKHKQERESRLLRKRHARGEASLEDYLRR
ncbi:hypothetical protein AC579_7259 [Pseudocercospora musae]|uniref:Uncharacterized protein n=1 Tax=Pseudocercospora musae TaxID=113226 RepID=A0A139I9N7_9PEZI|nr:hypothetical protein AC579_7259 [Pseudocercospora musae]